MSSTIQQNDEEIQHPVPAYLVENDDDDEFDHGEQYDDDDDDNNSDKPLEAVQVTIVNLDETDPNANIHKCCGYEFKLTNTKLIGSIVAFTLIAVGATIAVLVYYGTRSLSSSSPSSLTRPAPPSPADTNKYPTTPSPSISQLPTFSERPSLAPSITKRWQEYGPTITGSQLNERSGRSVGISADGDTLVVGSRYHKDVDGKVRGNVRVFTYNSTTSHWDPLGSTLYGTRGKNVELGGAVSVSHDGRRIAITMPKYRFNWDKRLGSRTDAYEYNTTTSDWVMVGDNTLAQALEEFSIESTAISSDGQIVISAAPEAYQEDIKRRGFVSTAYDGGVEGWKLFERGDLVLFGDDVGGKFGFSLALNFDGLIFAASSIGHDESKGKVQVKRHNDVLKRYESVGFTLYGDKKGDQFGYSVDLSDNASIIAIGIPYSDVNGDDSGNVKVYRYNEDSSDWEQLGNEIHGEAAGDLCGFSVKVSSDGQTVVASAIGHNNSTGKVRAFGLTDHGWSSIGPDIIGENEGDQFGFHIDLSSDANTVAVGAPYSDTEKEDSGSVKVYRFG